MLSLLFAAAAAAHLYTVAVDARRPGHDPGVDCAYWRAVTAVTTAAAAATATAGATFATVVWTWVALQAMWQLRESLAVGIPET